MKNVEHNNDSTQDNTNGATSITCPNGVTWCARHEEELDFCWSRTIQVSEAELSVSNGTMSGRPKLWGLADFENDALELDVALHLAAAITSLLSEVW